MASDGIKPSPLWIARLDNPSFGDNPFGDFLGGGHQVPLSSSLALAEMTLNRTGSALRTRAAQPLLKDEAAPPDDQAADERIVYVGTWIGEVRQPVELKGRPNAVLREIWVRLPSGRDKKWRTNEDVFSALEGHRVGALVGPSTQPDREFVIGMVNFSTGEKRMFWTSNQPGCGCVLWVILFAMLGFVQRAADVWLYAWAVAFLTLSAVTYSESQKISKQRKRDISRLDYLAAHGAARLSGG